METLKFTKHEINELLKDKVKSLEKSGVSQAQLSLLNLFILGVSVELSLFEVQAARKEIQNLQGD